MLKLMGWTPVDKEPVPEPKAVILGVPHTSIWDFLVSYFYYKSIGGDPHIMIKKEFFFWPMGPILRKLGAIPVDRGKGAALLVRSIIHEFEKKDRLHLAIAPEGTRKAVKKWKSGFHTIARAAGVPVYLGYFDWGTKRVGHGPRFEISDNAAADLEKIQAIYEEMHLTGMHPKGYTTGRT